MVRLEAGKAGEKETKRGEEGETGEGARGGETGGEDAEAKGAPLHPPRWPRRTQPTEVVDAEAEAETELATTAETQATPASQPTPAGNQVEVVEVSPGTNITSFTFDMAEVELLSDKPHVWYGWPLRMGDRERLFDQSRYEESAAEALEMLREEAVMSRQQMGESGGGVGGTAHGRWRGWDDTPEAAWMGRHTGGGVGGTAHERRRGWDGRREAAPQEWHIADSHFHLTRPQADAAGGARRGTALRRGVHVPRSCGARPRVE